MRRLTSLGIFLRSGRRSLVAVLCVSMFILMIYIFIQHSSDKSPRSSGNVSIDIAPRASPKLGMSPKAPKKKDGEKLTQADLLIYQPAANTTVLRALLLFYPNDQENDFIYELRWFFRSWIEMMTAEPPLWRTDLIVYASEYSAIFKELGCVLDQVRLNATEPTQCRVFPYVRIKNRNSKHDPSSRHQVIDQKRSEALYQHLRGYGYIDSINTVLEYNNSYSMYNYVLRTDMDCFLTLNFARYVPYDDSLIVGRGGYSTEFNQKRLRRIARDMGWSHAGQTALGSTWYGPASMIYRTANFTIAAMLHLSINEFSTPEREQRLGVMLWPEWHYGVLLLYGGHLAINHLIEDEHFDVGLASELLDQGVTSHDQKDIKKNLRLHLHCWHGDEPFSKFAFKAGKYDKINTSELLDDHSSSGYAMRLALEAKRMTPTQLKEKFLNVTKELV